MQKESYIHTRHKVDKEVFFLLLIFLFSLLEKLQFRISCGLHTQYLQIFFCSKLPSILQIYLSANQR